MVLLLYVALKLRDERRRPHYSRQLQSPPRTWQQQQQQQRRLRCLLPRQLALRQEGDLHRRTRRQQEHHC